MPFRGYWDLDGVEFANSSRVVDHLRPSSDDTVSTCGCTLKVPYDDSWPGLREYLYHSPYAITNAPWYSPTNPVSSEFVGVWVMDVQGLDTVPVQRDVTELIGKGAAAAVSRDTSRPVTFSVLVVGCTNAGARFGLSWLTCILRDTAASRRGMTLNFLGAHPADTAATPDSLWRQLTGVVMTSSPTVTETSGRANGARHRQSSVLRVDFTLTALNPTIFSRPTQTVVEWDTTTTESISWVHEPDCESPSDCDLPVLFNADCIPEVVHVTPAPVPKCGGCLPVCGLQRRVWELPMSNDFTCGESTMTVAVSNPSTDENLTVNLWWQVGSAEVGPCEQLHPLQIAGLPPEAMAVADSISGRPYAVVDGNVVRQVGIVGTQSGAPWQPTVLDRSWSWYLVAEAAPDVEFEVIVLAQSSQP